MIGCNQVKRLIDESDNPAVLPYEVVGHMDECQPCKQFAHERTMLREMLASTERVSAPLNFDAMLRARLAERTASRTPRWLAPAFYVRFGAAAAVLLVAIMAAQSGSFFLGPQTDSELSPGPDSKPESGTVAQNQPAAPASGITAQKALAQPESVAMPARPNRAVQAAYASYNRSSRSARMREFNAGVARDFDTQDGAVVLVRGKDGEREVPMPTVSVGAQSLLYQTAGRPVVNNIRASF